MNAFLHFSNNKKPITIHIKNLLTEINTHLSETTRVLHNFNTSLNKFIAVGSSKDLHPKPTAKTINTFIQNLNESPKNQDTLLNTKFQNDSILFVLQTPFKTITRHEITFARCSNKTKQSIYSNTNNYKHQYKRKSVYKRIIITVYHYKHLNITSLFSYQNKKYTQTEITNQQTTKLSIMPPSPVNLPFSTDNRTPVLEPLLRKPSPFVSTPQSTTEKLFASPTNCQNTTSPAKTTPITIPINMPDLAPETTATIPVSQQLSTTAFRDVLTTIPTSIAYSSDTIYLLCQLRRGKNDTVNDALAALHNDGSAPLFIETLITASFLARPTTSDLHTNLRIRQIQYEHIKNLTPTYSISFGSVYNETDKDRTYACHGTPKFQELQTYLNDFVFERWHVQDNLDLDVMKDVLSSIHFTIPPCNHPRHKPIAFVAGLPPQVFGRKTFHTQIIVRHLHTLLKPLLPSSSPLHNLCYFLQAFGLQVRRNYTFKEGLQEDVYIACISNTSDHRLLANILFPSQSNASPQLPILNLPVTFIPLPTRPPKSAKVALSRYYQTVTTIATAIRSQRTMLETLPFITTSMFKDTASPSSCKLILDNSNVITYAILHSIQKGINTRLYVTNKNTSTTQTDDTIRSWFNSSDHTKLFFPRATKHPPSLQPSPTMLQSIVLNLDATIAQYATAIGFKQQPTQSNTTTNIIKNNLPSNQTTNKTITSKSNTSTTSPLLPQIPLSVNPPPIISPINNTTNPPQIPLISNLLDAPSTTIIPRKRTASHSPSQSSESSSISSPSKDSPTQELSSSPTPHKPTAPDSNNDDESPTNSPTQEATPDHDTYSIRIDGITATLKNSIPPTKHPFIDDDDITTKALDVYEATNQSDAMLQAKADLLTLADTKINEYKKMRASKKKTKVRSAKKKKKSLKETNPYLI